MNRQISGIRPELLAACILAAAVLPAYADGPTFAELLERAKAEEAAGHRWAPPGDNMTETVIRMMDMVPQASSEQIAELAALLDHGRSEPAVAEAPPASTVAVASVGATAELKPAASPLLALPREVPPAMPPLKQDSGRAGVLFARGLEAERRGDISGARRFYTASAEQGDAAAARNLGRLYDPVYLGTAAVGGIDPDPVLAQQWYQRAVHLGDTGAKPLLEALSVRQQ